MLKKGYTNNNFIYLSAMARIAMNLTFIVLSPLVKPQFLYTIIVKAIWMA